MSDLTLRIDKMTCGGCAATVEKALRAVPGVNEAAVNLIAGTARVKGSPDERQLVGAVERAGYHAAVLHSVSAKTVADIARRGQTEESAMFRRLMLGLVFGIPAIFIELLLQHQIFVAVHFYADFGLGQNIGVWILATLAIAVAGWPFFVHGFKSALHARPNMDTLVALGAGTAYLASTVSLIFWLSQPHHAFDPTQPAICEFHAALAIILLIALGKYLEARAKRRAMSAVAGLADRAAATATRIAPDGALETIRAEQIAIGDRLQVLAHQPLPVDGRLIEGSGSLDCSIVTGESIPVELSAPPPRPPPRKKSLSLSVLGNAAAQPAGDIGDTSEILPGGAILSDGRIIIQAASTAATSTVARILELVNNAQAGKTKIQGTADRVAGIFVPIVLLLAILDFALWTLIGGWAGWQAALLTSIATVVIACPCAMGLATPTAITVAMGRAAKLGILFTQASALEAGRTIGTVVFDKTGTLTTGKVELQDTQPASGNVAVAAGQTQKAREAGYLQIAASLEQFSEHPIARATVAAAAAQSVKLLPVESFSSVPGGGVKGRIGEHEYAMGSPTFLEQLGADVGEVDAAGKTVAAIAQIGGARPHLIAVLTFRDALRSDAAETIRRLKSGGMRVGVLSGDHDAAVRAAIQGLDVDFIRSGIKPGQKAAALAQWKSRDGAPGVAFVGDGINDAPALAAADLGIAMGTGTDIARRAGDVLLMSNRLAAIPETLQLSRRTLRIIRQNLFWAFAYNIAAIPLAMAGILPPAAAAAAMMFSSLSVVANALRLYGVKLDHR